MSPHALGFVYSCDRCHIENSGREDQEGAVGGIREEFHQPTLGMDLGSCHEGRVDLGPRREALVVPLRTHPAPDRRLLQQLQRVSVVMNSNLFSQIAS